jgi:hypothetical protein
MAAGAAHGAARGVAEWVDLYAGLTKLLDRLLEERGRFVRGYPASRRKYLDLDEVKVLQEGRASFQRRLEYWRHQRVPVS